MIQAIGHEKCFDVNLDVMLGNLVVLQQDDGSKSTPRPKFSVASVEVILSQCGIEPPNLQANRTLVGCVNALKEYLLWEEGLTLCPGPVFFL